MNVWARYADRARAVAARKAERFGPASDFQVAWLPDDAWREYPWALVVKSLPPLSPAPAAPAPERITLSPATRWFRDNVLEPKGLPVG